MNGEELELAFRLDGLDSILWWFRSREKEDFYLQGWKQGKFYPDFIIKTKSGKYVLVEYKGEDRLSNEDTAYKVELGDLWEELSGHKNKFYLASKKNSETLIKELSSLF
jgi:type III restriction enzyme